jgi:hypothetical protein
VTAADLVGVPSGGGGIKEGGGEFHCGLFCERHRAWGYWGVKVRCQFFMGYNASTMATEIDNKLTLPARHGVKWEDEETITLLVSIQKKKTIQQIAEEHKRTPGSINSYLRKLAVDYHFNDGRTMEEIQQFTGLTKTPIDEAICKAEIKSSKTDIKTIGHHKFVIKGKVSDPTTADSEMISLLKDIQHKLNLLLEKVM